MLRTTVQGLVRSGSVSHFPRSIHFERLDPDQHPDEPLRLPSSRMREGHLREAHWHMRTSFRRSEPLAIHPSLRRRATPFAPETDVDDNASGRSSESADGQTSFSVLRSISRMHSLAAEQNLRDDDVLSQYIDRHLSPAATDEPSTSVSDPVIHDSNLGWLSRNRNFDRFSQNDRERERIPAALLRRWTYHPFSDGGDVLPAMFDVSTPSRRPSRALDGKPLITLENHSSVTPLVEDVTQQFSSMLSDLQSIDNKVEQAERRFENFKDAKNKKKEEEEQVKESEKASNEEQRVEIRDHDEGGDNNADNQEMDDANQEASEGSEAVPSDSNLDMSRQTDENQAELGSGLQQAIPRSAPGLGNIQEEVPLPDLVMDSIEVSRRRGSEQQQNSTESQSENPIESQNHEDLPSTPREPTETDQGASQEAPQENGGESVDPPSNNFSEVVAQRAAAAGISLDAPANVNPAVVAAATESTGIDPAFLAALPEEMRTEILTQYYDSIRTNTNAQSDQTSAGATNINLDFLIALPPALRTEVLEMEAQFQSRQEAQNGSRNVENGDSNAQGSQMPGAEMDNATFLATLPPELREEVLLTSGEDFIQSLPPHVAAEARLLREREMNARAPWGQQGSPYGSDRRAPGILRSGSNGRHERNRRRAAPTLRWRKVDDGWLRELKDGENEPDAFLDIDGIASLVNLLWIRHPEFGKEQIYQVFRFACRTTSTRQLVLHELVNLVTSSDSESPGAESSVINARDFEHGRLHATAVRRGLEILYMICKDDKIVSEFLLGLPHSPEELHDCTTTPFSKLTYKATSLSTLMALMQTKLFNRSDSHMDQLIRLISLISASIPPAKSNENVQLKGRRDRRHARMLLDRSSLTEPMGLFMVDVDDDDIFPMPEEDDDEEVDSYEELFAPRTRVQNESRAQATNEATEQNGKDEEKKKKEGEEDTIVSSKFRVPRLKESELIALTSVLLRSSCVNETHSLTTRCIGRLGELPENRKIFMSSLVKIAQHAGADIEREYEGIVGELREGSGPSDASKKKLILSSFLLGSNANDVTLLRVVKSLSELLKHEVVKPELKSGKEEKEKGILELGPTDTSIGEYRRSMSDGLSGVWAALDKLLELVADETRTRSTKAGKRGSSSTPSVAEMLGPQRKRASSRALSPMLSRLSPVIESFIVMHTVENSEVSPREDSVPQSPLELTHGSPRSPSWKFRDDGEVNDAKPKTVDDELAVFVERHRVPINTLLRASPELLHTSFKGTLKHPHAIDFDNKKAYFRDTIRLRSSQNRIGSIKISVRRDRVLDDSYSQLRMRTPDEMKGRLHVQFTGEEGVDAGGVTRECPISVRTSIGNILKRFVSLADSSRKQFTMVS
ncbi:Ubiquitin binding protein [Gracilaria domingensis]|nr:Ubiquitin binding protein [Gracilaria domingensis]